MSIQATIKKSFTDKVILPFILLPPLILLTIALNWHTADIEHTIEYTLALVNGLSIGSLAFYIVALLGFAFSHTTNGKRIILPINMAAVAIFIMWPITYFYLAPAEPWEIDPLSSMLNTQIIISMSIAAVPFIYFYFSGLKLRKKNAK